jgi:hypothetical protein
VADPSGDVEPARQPSEPLRPSEIVGAVLSLGLWLSVLVALVVNSPLGARLTWVATAATVVTLAFIGGRRPGTGVRRAAVIVVVLLVVAYLAVAAFIIWAMRDFTF